MKYTISVLTHSAIKAARRCIESVLQSNIEADFELILTANGSAEAEALFNSFTPIRRCVEIRVVVNAKNLGFIDPSNHALTLARGEYFILLNDDTVVPEGWTEKLSAPFERDPKCAATGPRGTCQTLSMEFIGFKGQILDYIEGSCMMVRTALAQQHGLFSPYLKFAYGEDADFCLRMRQKGLTIYQVDFPLQHTRGVTSALVPGIGATMRQNFGVLRRRWEHYLKVRRFDYPIIITRTGAIGDVLLTTPVIRKLHVERPLSPIYVFTRCPEVFRGNLDVVKATNEVRDLASIAPLAEKINLDMSYERTPERNILDSYAESCGVALDEIDRKTFFNPSAFDRGWAKDFMGAPIESWITIHVGPNGWKSRNWPKERFASVATQLMAEGFKVAVFSSEVDATPCDVRIPARCTLHQLGAAFSRCRLFIGIDSAPAHIAQAMKVPIITIHGPTDPDTHYTSESEHIALIDRSVPEAGIRSRVKNVEYVECSMAPILAITVDQVLDAARKIMRLETETESVAV